jgi:hypothetical protein
VARRGLALLPRHVLERLLDASSPTLEDSLRHDGASRVSLTPREHEVLAAMADGVSLLKSTTGLIRLEILVGWSYRDDHGDDSLCHYFDLRLPSSQPRRARTQACRY